MVISPCAAMVPVVYALRESYRDVMEKGTDVKSCRGMHSRGFFVVSFIGAMKIDQNAVYKKS
jgi:hypothetical protein